MSLRGSSNSEKIWNYFKAKGLNDYGIAGLLGNLDCESGLNPKNLENTYERKLGYSDEEYCAAVDNDSYTNFVKDSAGWGICQWTWHTRKQSLLNYARSKNKSIGDLEVQLDFLYKELSENYKSVLTTLKTAKSVQEASNAVLLKFERPYDQSVSVQNKRASYGQKFIVACVDNLVSGHFQNHGIQQNFDIGGFQFIDEFLGVFVAGHTLAESVEAETVVDALLQNTA